MKGFQLKITIKGSKPPIWRRVIVPDQISFADLDMIIESVFGWTHSHLFKFYFKEEDARITCMPDDYTQDDAEQEKIDDWFFEDRTCSYVYDFSDYWEHTIQVEKIVPYTERCATVIKSKGPYMIEDCGGILGFYEYIQEAEAFNLEEANKELSKMKFDVFSSYTGAPISSLLEVLLQYQKKDLVTIAKLYGFSNYSGFNKNELAQWLSNHLLDTAHLKTVLESTTTEELELFEEAMKKESVAIDEELLSSSLFLCTYGAYNSNQILKIPSDVAAKYNKIVTPGFKKQLEEKQLIELYCESACYLYGAVPLEQLIKIYNQYEPKPISEDEFKQIACDLIDTRMMIYFKDGYLISSEFIDGEEEDFYKGLLEDQGDCTYYIPKDREEFLNYGRFDYQEPDENAEKFLLFLLEKYKLGPNQAFMIFQSIQQEMRMNTPICGLTESMTEYLEESGKRINNFKQIKELEDQLKKMRNHTRLLCYRGHTPAEINSAKSSQKIISFPAGKKVYPNDLCPCGSGKKYKHCCGRK